MPTPPIKLRLLPLVMVLFFTVSGGAYGLEDLVSASGPGMALLLIIITPLIWSLPVALMVSELSAALPEEGGYYVWVKTALSPYWGFQVAWWSWLMSFVDMAIYPVLFANYLSTLFIEYADWHYLSEHAWAHWGVTLLVIWPLAALNIRGAVMVGLASRWFGGIVLLPFAVLSVIGIYHWSLNPAAVWQPWIPESTNVLQSFGVGLFVVMWNYMGWDIIANVAGEIEQPQRNLPRALALTIPLIMLAYLFPVFAGLTSGFDWQQWTSGSFPKIASAVAGEWLGVWLGLAALVSSAGLFNALLLSFSRIPFVLANDAYLPKQLTYIHKRYQTPYIAILVCACIYSLFSLSAFASLIVVDVVLYAAVIMLEYAALITLRLKQPELPRPFKVGGGWWGVLLICILPLAILLLAIISTVEAEGAQAVIISLAALATGPLIYPYFNKKRLLSLSTNGH